MPHRQSLQRDCIVRQNEVFRLAEKRGFTLVVLSKLTGIPEATLSTYRDKPSRATSLMSYAAVIALMKALPDELADMLIEPSGYSLKPRERGPKNWMAFAERTAIFTSKVCRYQATGPGIDHQEDADLTEDARRLAAEAQVIAA